MNLSHPYSFDLYYIQETASYRV